MVSACREQKLCQQYNCSLMPEVKWPGNRKVNERKCEFGRLLFVTVQKNILESKVAEHTQPRESFT